MKRAFSLIELLVVISIIALLIAILLPALSTARESGRAVICLSNERQLMLANEMHANDHDGLYVHNQYDGQTTINGRNFRKYWVLNEQYLDYIGFSNTQISNVTVGGNNFNQVWGSRWPDQFLCPTAPEVESPWNHRLSYGYNRRIIGQYEREKIVEPDTKYAYADSQGWWVTWQTADYTRYWDVYGEERSVNNLAGVAYRHHERVNIAFFDGHAEMLEKTEVFLPGRQRYNDLPWHVYIGGPRN